MKETIKKDAKRILVICVASFVMAVNIKTFVQTGNLIPGGATGLTILIQRAFEHFFQLHIPYTLLNLSINAVPVYIGFRYIGKKFTIYSCLTIFLTSIFTDLIPTAPCRSIFRNPQMLPVQYLLFVQECPYYISLSSLKKPHHPIRLF